MDKINEKERIIIIQMYIKGNTNSKISNILKIPVKIINSILKEYLNKRDIDIPKEFAYRKAILNHYMYGYPISYIAKRVGVKDAFIEAILFDANLIEYTSTYQHPRRAININTINLFKNAYCKIGDKFIIKAPYNEYEYVEERKDEIEITIQRKFNNYASTNYGDFVYFDIMQGRRVMN